MNFGMKLMYMEMNQHYNMRAKAVNFERGQDPKRAMEIGLLGGEELQKALVDQLWPDAVHVRYSREAGTPRIEDVMEWAEYFVEDNKHRLDEIQPDQVSVQDFAEQWDMY